MTKQNPTTPVVANVALPTLSGHRLAGKVQRQRVDLAVGIKADEFYAATGVALDVPQFRQMVADTVYRALADIPGALIDKFPSADFPTGINAYGFEEELDLASINWCETSLHSDECEADHSVKADEAKLEDAKQVLRAVPVCSCGDRICGTSPGFQVASRMSATNPIDAPMSGDFRRY